MAKRSRKARKVSAARTRQASSSATDAVTGAFDDASSSIKRLTSGIPASAFYWGLGAVALGAAAVGAYMYRGRIMEMYESAVDSVESIANEYMASSDEESTTEESQDLEPARKAKNVSGLSQPANKH